MGRCGGGGKCRTTDHRCQTRDCQWQTFFDSFLDNAFQSRTYLRSDLVTVELSNGRDTRSQLNCCCPGSRFAGLLVCWSILAIKPLQTCLFQEAAFLTCTCLCCTRIDVPAHCVKLPLTINPTPLSRKQRHLGYRVTRREIVSCTSVYRYNTTRSCSLA